MSQGATPPDFVDMFWSILDERDAIGDPLLAEIVTGEVLATLGEADTFDDADGPTVALTAMDASSVGRIDVRTLVAYRCLATATNGPGQTHARRRAAAIEKEVGRVPSWVRDLGTATPQRAEVMEDPLGDGLTVHVEFTYPSGDQHCLGVYIDTNLGGLIKDTLIGPSLDELHRIVGQQPEIGLTLRPIDLDEARARIEEGYRILDMTLEPPVDESVWHLRPLVQARLQGLPAGGSATELEEVPQEDRERLVDDFVASTEAIGSITSHGQEDVRSIAELLVDHASDYAGGDPLRCSPVTVELFMVDWFPRKVLSADELAPAVPDTVRAWVRWAGAQKSIEPDLVESTAHSVGMWETALIEGIDDPATWGPAKAMLTQMLADGVDPADENAVGDWVDRFNADPERALPGSPALPDNVVPFPGTDTPFGPEDPYDDLDFDAEMDAMLESEERADRHAAAVLRSALADRAGEVPPGTLAAAATSLREGYSGGSRPHGHMAPAIGLTTADLKELDDTTLVLTSAGAAVEFVDDPGLDSEEQAAVMTLESGDWVALTLQLVRRGPGTDMDTDRLAALMDDCPEVLSFSTDPDDRALITFALEVVKPWLAAAGVIGREDRLTELGAWILPRAVCRTYGIDFDATAPTEAEPFDWAGIDDELRVTVNEILGSIEQICAEALDHEYLTLARRAVAELARLPRRPLARGRAGIWAGGVLYAVGQLNHLFHRGAEPGLAGKDLIALTGEKQGSVTQKARRVRELLEMADDDPRYLRWELAEDSYAVHSRNRVFNI